jgi:dTDP-4-dehydrorhamnose reductase
MKVVLLIGGAGYVGGKIQKALLSRGIKCVTLSRETLNYCNFRTLLNLLSELKPDVLINAGGFTGKPNVDQCEKEKSECIKGNLLLPQVIGQACDFHGVPLVHISSGCIFSGDKGKDANGNIIGFNEEDSPNFCFTSTPCSFYSGTKELAEQVLSDFEMVYTCRLRIPFDEISSPRNYLTKLQNYRRLHEAVNSISHLGDFANCCVDLFLNKCEYGTYNITNSGFISTREVAGMIKDAFNLNKDFDFWGSDEEFYRVAAVAPRSNCIMDNSKLLSTGIEIRDCKTALEHSLINWVA